MPSTTKNTSKANQHRRKTAKSKPIARKSSSSKPALQRRHVGKVKRVTPKDHKHKYHTKELLRMFDQIAQQGIRALPKPRIPKIKISSGRGDPETAVLILSDIQVGHRTPSTSGDIIWERLRRLAKRIIKVVTLHRKSFPIKELKIFLLGDIIQSEDVGHKVGLGELEMVLMKQIFAYAVPMLLEFLLTLEPHFEKITVHTVSGNHGRLDKFHADSTNFDTIIYKMLEASLRNHKKIEWNIAMERFYQIVSVMGHKFLLTHGDTIKMWMNIPFYGIIQRVTRWMGSIPGAKQVKYVVMGHFHVVNMYDWNELRIFVNGCFVTEDQWVLKGIGTDASAQQILFGVHKKQGVTWVNTIKLD